MPRMPDRIYIDKNDRELYDKLKEIFPEKENKELFLFAMAVGFKNDIRRPLKTREGFVRTEYLRPDDETLLYALAMYKEGIDILSNKEEVFRIAEEYAHAGVKILADEIESSSFGSFAKKFEKELFDLFKRIEQGSEYDDKDTSS